MFRTKSVERETFLRNNFNVVQERREFEHARESISTSQGALSVRKQNFAVCKFINVIAINSCVQSIKPHGTA